MTTDKIVPIQMDVSSVMDEWMLHVVPQGFEFTTVKPGFAYPPNVHRQFCF
jgi:hypothetical protein